MFCIRPALFIWTESVKNHVLNTLNQTVVLFTYVDVSARPSISDLRLFSDRRTILFGRVLRNGLLQCFGTFKMPILMFISILVFRPEGQIWNPVRRDTRIYVRRILNASRISKTQLNSCTISPS